MRRSNKIYTFKDLLKMGVNEHTLRMRFYQEPEKYGVKEYDRITKIKGIDRDTFNEKWKHLIKEK